MLKLCLSLRERARTEETEAAHPAVPATGPEEVWEVFPEPVFVFEFSLFLALINLRTTLVLDPADVSGPGPVHTRTGRKSRPGPAAEPGGQAAPGLAGKCNPSPRGGASGAKMRPPKRVRFLDPLFN